MLVQRCNMQSTSLAAAIRHTSQASGTSINTSRPSVGPATLPDANQEMSSERGSASVAGAPAESPADIASSERAVPWWCRIACTCSACTCSGPCSPASQPYTQETSTRGEPKATGITE